MKRCTKCGETKPLDAFGPRLHGKDGKQAQCRGCLSAAAREWRKDNPEKAKNLVRRYQKNNIEKVRERNRKWHAANTEKDRENQRRWRRANPEKYKEAKRRHLEAHPRQHREQTKRTGKRNQLNNYSNLRRMFGSVCIDCRREYPMPIYDYHHLDPTTKNGHLNLNGWSWKRVEAYVQGCVQLCPTCHRLRHYFEREKLEMLK